MARTAWPVALVLFAVPEAVDRFAVDRYSGPEVLYAPLVILPLLLAVLWTSYAIGGRRGAVVGAVLLGLMAYWSWWFGWGVYDVGSGFSFRDAAGLRAVELGARGRCAAGGVAVDAHAAGSRQRVALQVEVLRRR